MRKKPKGRRFRNLTARDETIYYQRRVNGRRVRFSTGTNDWEAAVSFRDRFEAEMDFEIQTDDVRTFGELAKRYLAEGMRELATTTQTDYRRMLERGGPVRDYFGAMPVDTITPPVLHEWWSREIMGGKLSRSTGLNRLSGVAVVLRMARRLGEIETSPVEAFRRDLRDDRRTKHARAQAAGGSVVVLESIEATAAFLQHSAKVAEARKDAEAGERDHMATLLMLDAALRISEVAGLTWDSVCFAEPRHLLIDKGRPRGGAVEKPKSGRTRRVAVSRRLHVALRARWVAQGQPDTGPVLPGFSQANYSRRHFAKVAAKAKAGGLTPHGLRHSWASLLLSAGFPLGYVQRQLGHGTSSITENVYARWLHTEDTYVPPPELGPGEVPADVLSRVPEAKKRPQEVTPPALAHHGKRG